MNSKLTPKQAAFVQEYLVDLCATKAAIRAGYSKPSARVTGSQNLTKLNIQVAIKTAMNARQERTEITQDMVIAELAKPGFVDIRKIFTKSGQLISPTELPADIAAAIQSIEVVVRATGETDEDGNREVEYVHKIRFHDKIKPLELIGRHLGMFSNNTGLNPANITFNMNYGGDEDRRIPQSITIEHGE